MTTEERQEDIAHSTPAALQQKRLEKETAAQHPQPSLLGLGFLGLRPTSSPNIPEGPTHHVIGFKNLKSLGSLRKCKSEWGIENGNLYFTDNHVVENFGNVN
jgi:hypothetical protein